MAARPLRNEPPHPDPLPRRGRGKISAAWLRGVASVVLVAAQVVVIAGCGVLPFYIRANERLPENEAVPPTRARTTMTVDELPQGVFVGIAMSGGGSRAANFSAALLFELEKLGLLPRYVSALSSVSGSSLAAGYYGLFARQPEKWNPDRVKERLLTDFEAMWITRWFLPHNALRYWFTKFDRSDIMKGVFDRVLFEGKRFDDMPPDGPRILLNATALGESGVRFAFTDEKFRNRGSRLDTYPVSHAVMASAAFPAAFAAVTLEVYGRGSDGGRYLHVYDGGPADNLGITTLVEDMVRSLYGADPKPQGCFLFVFDAHTFDPAEQIRGQGERDPRGLIDFFVDLNALDASSVLLSKDRRVLLHGAGIDKPGHTPVGRFRIHSRAPLPVELGECTVWALTFDRLWELAADAPEARRLELRDLARTVNRIQTRFLLAGPEGMTPQHLQDALYEAARVLVWEDRDSLSRACDWFQARRIELAGCAGRGPAR